MAKPIKSLALHYPMIQLLVMRNIFCFFKISLAITGMNAVCPVFFKLIAMMEQYHPRTALYWELTRYVGLLSVT